MQIFCVFLALKWWKAPDAFCARSPHWSPRSGSLLPVVVLVPAAVSAAAPYLELSQLDASHPALSQPAESQPAESQDEASHEEASHEEASQDEASHEEASQPAESQPAESQPADCHCVASQP